MIISKEGIKYYSIGIASHYDYLGFMVWMWPHQEITSGHCSKALLVSPLKSIFGCLVESIEVVFIHFEHCFLEYHKSCNCFNSFLFFFRAHIYLQPSVKVPIELYLVPFIVVFGVCFLFMVIFSVSITKTFKSDTFFLLIHVSFSSCSCFVEISQACYDPLEHSK